MKLKVTHAEEELEQINQEIDQIEYSIEQDGNRLKSLLARKEELELNPSLEDTLEEVFPLSKILKN